MKAAVFEKNHFLEFPSKTQKVIFLMNSQEKSQMFYSSGCTHCILHLTHILKVTEENLKIMNNYELYIF